MTSRVDLLGTRPRSIWSGWSRGIGVTLLAGWVLLISSTLLSAERGSSLPSLQEAARNGDVSVVHTAGGLGPRERGVATLELTWRDGLFRYWAEVREARPFDGAAAARPGDSVVTRVDGTQAPRVRAGVVERLEEYRDLRVEEDGEEAPNDLYGDIYGWRLPAWAVMLTAALTVGGWVLLICGPQPWRATRWAWFWLSGIGTPIGQLAYLILGGPASFGTPPRDYERGLTGGWAFLFACVVVPLVWWGLVSLQ